MEDVFSALNKLVEAGLIETYALGGGVGAAFYVEATQTETLDVLLPRHVGGIYPIRTALLSLGAIAEEGASVRLGFWLVRLVQAQEPPIVEAIQAAIPVEFNGIRTRVLSAEYLCALALQSNRIVDQMQVCMFFEENKVDRARLRALAERYGFRDTLQQLELQFSTPRGPQRGAPGEDRDKVAMLVSVKTESRRRLRAQSWPEKVAAIEAMNAAPKLTLVAYLSDASRR